MASKQSLYGAPRPRSGFQRAKEIPSSTSLAFSSQLSSLLAQSASTTSQPTSARARPSKAKDDIFKTHNKNSKKRALADISRDDGALGGHRQDIGDVDAADLHRSKRKMEEKARLYAAMKRGDYVPPSSSRSSNNNNAEEHSLVDFDRKWAEDVEAGRHHEPDMSSDDGSGSGNDSAAESLVDYEDEFGRQRHVTRSERSRETRRRDALAYAESQLQSFAARPAAPSTVIRGDTIQAAAFNPDHTVSEQMAELARKRDKSLTPPPETHYDASKEIRAKG
ncbi:MAG: hypothetical protein Q9173_004053, partial [Seirophora scorigena]